MSKLLFFVMWYNIVTEEKMSPGPGQNKIYNTPLMMCFDYDTFLNFTLLSQFVMIAI